MFAKRLLQKALHHSQHNLQYGCLKSVDMDPRVAIHYGIPTTASVLAFDPIQRLLAIGTLDGRIKVIGGDGIEGLLFSPKQLPYKNLEFLQNQGLLVSILNDSDIQVWSLESRSLACCLQWESNITAFSVISGSSFMYIGDEYGLISVIKYEAAEGKLVNLPYNISAKSIREAAGYPSPIEQPIVGVLPQPCSSGNRVLIAFEDGLLVLWDISEERIHFVGGDKDLQLKDEGVNASKEVEDPVDSIEQHLGDKEISALCWASSSGSILAVGYIDGDILFWNMSLPASAKGQQTSSSPNNVVKLQLSSAERRLPVIVLQWSNSHKSRNGCDGKLFIYGGDEIGSEEVLTVLNLEWSSGMETVRCVGRADITLAGSFADMILLPGAGTTSVNNKDDLFILTNPGQLHFYDNGSLSTLITHQERRPSVSAVEFPMVIPIADPSMTVAKLIKLPSGGNSSKVLSEVASVMRTGSMHSPSSSPNWPLTGGVPSKISINRSNGIERVYLAGYSDGSVRMWDATYPLLSSIFFLEGEVQRVKVAGSSAPVSKLDFCSGSSTLAVGNERGLVHVYDLKGCSDGTKFHFVTETKCEVLDLPQGKGPYCRAVFCLLGSPIESLLFSNSGNKLAVGFECGRVAVFDMTSLTILFLVDMESCARAPVSSMTWMDQACVHRHVKSPKHSETKVTGDHAEEVIFIFSKDTNINVIEGGTGKTIGNWPVHLKKESVAISMYVIELTISGSELLNDKQPEEPFQEIAITDNPTSESSPKAPNTKKSHDTEHHSSEAANSEETLLESLVLLCCEDSLRLYSAKSVFQGTKKPIQKVKYAKPCCWTALVKKDEKVCGLVSLFQTGIFEIRSLPDLELVEESSLTSILRWNFKANMDKTLSSDNTHIALVNGSEFAFVSLLAGENEFRSLECLPCLHDRVLAAACRCCL
ncbi:transducin family protein / WD-40 repeat family protein [Quillaja saponaria]|uniref:Transducin family protein / WD-40 repeat family protein n=1 Tax=Quillaja saponaria TaxID=32244 RepID=A0AAD7PCM0_QUISA|nr:transducin family protein / WD-40 repeat family protein [Quillaja saponaria]